RLPDAVDRIDTEPRLGRLGQFPRVSSAVARPQVVVAPLERPTRASGLLLLLRQLVVRGAERRVLLVQRLSLAPQTALLCAQLNVLIPELTVFLIQLAVLLLQLTVRVLELGVFLPQLLLFRVQLGVGVVGPARLRFGDRSLAACPGCLMPSIAPLGQREDRH